MPKRLLHYRPSALTVAATQLLERAHTSLPMATAVRKNGNLKKMDVLRKTVQLPPDPAYKRRTLAISDEDDDPAIRTKYRPFLLSDDLARSDWISQLELSTALKFVEADLQRTGSERLRVLVLIGSLRARSYSRLLAYECSRILFRLGCDVRFYEPTGLPVKDDVQHGHEKVQELRDLSKWSDGHVWVSPEQHGNLTAVFKNQIDWIPLNAGSVRPTQGRTLSVLQVSGGSQSFNAVNNLRILGRWMRMFTIPNQSSIPKAYTQFTDAADTLNEMAFMEAEGGSRLMPSGNRDRVVDCMEEFVKYTIIMRQHFDLFNDRFSERTERQAKSIAEQNQSHGSAEVVMNGVNTGAI